MSDFPLKKVLRRAPFYLALAMLVIQAVGPVVWMLNGSVKTQSEFYTNIWGISNSWMMENYTDAWNIARVGDFAANSVIVVALAISILLVTATMTAYALARIEF